MEILLIITTITIILISLGFAGLIWFFNQKFRRFEEIQKADKSLNIISQNMQGLQERIDKTTEAIGQRLDNAAKYIGAVSKELGRVQEIGRGMKDLQEFLRSPKLRGNIGEQVLRDLLEQFFSRTHFTVQYKFRTGQIVDAIIKTDKGIIPIDSKFPMENFRKIISAQNEEEKKVKLREFVKDVKKHIADISKKYILPQEGTVDFAVMYIPSEIVYYEIIRAEQDLNAYAYQNKVFPVSPNSFYYFLKVIMMAMEGKRIEEASKQVLQMLAAIQNDTKKFGEVLGVVNTHITNAKSAVDRANNEYFKLSGKIDQVRLLK